MIDLDLTNSPLPISRTYFTDNIAFMKQVPDKFFHLAVPDPAYGINVTNMNMGHNAPSRSGTEPVMVKIKKRGRLNSGGGHMKDSKLVNSDLSWDVPPPPEFFTELFRVSKNQIIFGGNYFSLPPTRCIIFWDKMQSFDNYSKFELGWTSFDFPAKLFRMANHGSNTETKIHPTQKPIELYSWLLDEFAEKGDIIFDPTLGSGSSRIAAHAKEFDFFGVDNSAIHFSDQEERFKKYSDIPLFRDLEPQQQNIFE